MNINFILMHPSTPGNIGSAARAIKTMGFRSLRLVNPCDHLSEEARKLAYGSHDILESAQIYYSLDDALSDIDFSIATTAKNRTVWHDYHSPEQSKNILKSKGTTIKNVALVFGREGHGLEGDELALCDLRSTIPMSGSYPSVNLAQSVMIYAYIFSNTPETNSSNPKSSKPPEQKVLKSRASELLHYIEVSKNQNLYRRMMERLMQSSEDDLHLFLSFHRYLKQKMQRLP